MNATELLASVNFNLDVDSRYKISHELGHIQLHVSDTGVVRADGYNQDNSLVAIVVLYKHLSDGQWKLSIKQTGTNQLSSGNRTASGVDETESISTVVGLAITTMLCRQIAIMYGDNGLNEFEQLCSSLSQTRKAEQKAALDLLEKKKAIEVSKKHRPITDNEILKLTRSLKGEALSGYSTAYIDVKTNVGNFLNIGCQASHNRVSWYVNFTKTSLSAVISILKEKGMIKLPEFET